MYMLFLEGFLCMHDEHAMYARNSVELAGGVSILDKERFGGYDCRLAPDLSLCTGLLQI